MNLKHKIEHAAYAWLLAGQDSSDYTGIPMYVSYGGKPTDADGAAVMEPAYPFITIVAVVSADQDLAGVGAYQLQIDLHTDSMKKMSERRARIAQLEALTQRMIQPPDPDETWSDSNREGGAFLAFANKPEVDTDEREEWRMPLHIYDINQQSDPTNQQDRLTNDSLVFVGTAQTMDSHDDP